MVSRVRDRYQVPEPRTVYTCKRSLRIMIILQGVSFMSVIHNNGGVCTWEGSYVMH